MGAPAHRSLTTMPQALVRYSRILDVAGNIIRVRAPPNTGDDEKNFVLTIWPSWTIAISKSPCSHDVHGVRMQDEAHALLRSVSHQNFHFPENQRSNEDKIEMLGDSVVIKTSSKTIGKKI
jgi:hypothetical protein